MTEERKKYRSVFLDKQTSEDSFRRETIKVTIGGETLPVEVRALSVGEFQGTQVPDALVDKVGQQTAQQLALICKCCYVPGTDDRIYNPPVSDDNLGDAEALANSPMDGSGPLGRLYAVINYVHGFRTEPPPEIQDPRLEEIKGAADHLKGIAESGEDLNAAEIKTMAELIAGRVRWIDSGSTSGK